MLITGTIYKEMIGHLDSAISGVIRVKTITDQSKCSDKIKSDIKQLGEEIMKVRFILDKHCDAFLEDLEASKEHCKWCKNIKTK